MTNEERLEKIEGHLEKIEKLIAGMTTEVTIIMVIIVVVFFLWPFGKG